MTKAQSEVPLIMELSPLDARIPCWNFERLQERVCPVCSSSESEKCYVRPDKLKVRKCGCCFTYYISPSPTSDELEYFYSHYDETHRREPDVPAELLAAAYRQADPLRNMQIQEIASMIDLRGKRMLDVGFGRGAFLFYFDTLGAFPHGVELDKKAVAFAKHYFDASAITEGTIFDIELSSRFDLIIMNDVIEHPLNPGAIFERAVELLSPGGLISILSPNGSFLGREEQPVALRVDLEHMQYLSFEACQFLASQNRVRITHLESFGFPGIVGIDGPPTKRSCRNVIRLWIRSKFKTLLGKKVCGRLGRTFAHITPERLGCYQLFCIFRKPDFPESSEVKSKNSRN